MNYLSDFSGTLMYQNEPSVKFSVKRGQIEKCEIVGNHLPFEFHAKLTEKEAIYTFLMERETPSTRYLIDEALHNVGIPYYDIVMMLRFNHGNSIEDDFWIKFDDEPDLRYEQVKLV